jgi:NADPH-dependent 2,4-dienoyl-CoA reductase/sulfur reductase-like enzyme
VTRKFDIVVAGAGPAGLAAASSAAEGGARVLVIDDNPHPGGQIWRAERGTIKSPEAARLVESLERNGVERLSDARVFDAAGRSVFCETDSGAVEIGFGRLIIATGARELFLPFPGWTLPGVYGAGGLQALVKGGLDVDGRRAVVSGTGPLLVAVAAFLAERGARVLHVAEQAPFSRVAGFGLGLWRAPSKLIQAFGLMRRLRRTRFGFGAYVDSAAGEGRLESVSIRDGSGRLSVECDLLACGFHLEPNTELAALVGCGLREGAVAVDEFQQTTVEGVYCAGEPAGIGGLETALAEGRIAGLAASGNTDSARKLIAGRDRLRRAADAMNRAFRLREELRELADPETIVCRCEDVPFASLAEFSTFRDAKLQTRCGMGACRGRICGAAARFIFGWEPDTVRPPIFLVRAESLCSGCGEQEPQTCEIISERK